VFHSSIFLVKLGENSTRRGPRDGEDNGVHKDGDEPRLPGEEQGRDGRDGQQNTWAQENEPEGGNNEVSWCQGKFENKFDDGPVEKGEHEGVKQDLNKETGSWGQAKQKAWTQEGKEDRGDQNFRTRDVNHVL